MADDGDLDAGHNEKLGGDSGQNVRKNIALHLKTGSAKVRRARKPGRPKKEDRHSQPEKHEGDEEVQLPPMKGPSEPLHRTKKLSWDHKVNLVGRRHMDPHIHCCESCKIPILIYGRVIPCKHVFCLDCAKKAEKKCMRCGDPVQRIEQAALGTVFICTHGGAKHGVSGCRRTYLSSRDLQAHVQYRHMRDEARQSARNQTSVTTTVPQREYQTSQPVAMLSPSQQPLNVQPMPGPYGDSMHVGPSYSAQPPLVVPQQMQYSQPTQGTTIESYHTMAMVAQPGHGHPSNLIAVPLHQHEQHAQAGYDARVPPPQIGQPPPAVNYVTAQGGAVAARGYPPVSYAATLPPPHHNAPQQAPIGHLQRGPAPVNALTGVPQRGVQTIVTTHQGVLPHSGPPPRGGPPPRFPQNQNFAQGSWQGQRPPAMGHRPRTASGAQPRY